VHLGYFPYNYEKIPEITSNISIYKNDFISLCDFIVYCSSYILADKVFTINIKCILLYFSHTIYYYNCIVEPQISVKH